MDVINLPEFPELTVPDLCTAGEYREGEDRALKMIGCRCKFYARFSMRISSHF